MVDRLHGQRVKTPTGSRHASSSASAAGPSSNRLAVSPAEARIARLNSRFTRFAWLRLFSFSSSSASSEHLGEQPAAIPAAEDPFLEQHPSGEAVFCLTELAVRWLLRANVPPHPGNSHESGQQQQQMDAAAIVGHLKRWWERYSTGGIGGEAGRRTLQGFEGFLRGLLQ